MDYGWRLKGFERFLSDFGIVEEEVGARERSVVKAVVQKVVQNIVGDISDPVRQRQDSPNQTLQPRH